MSRRQALTDAEAVAQVTLGLEVILEHHGWPVDPHAPHIGKIGKGGYEYFEDLMAMGARTMAERSPADKRTVQLNLLSGGFTPSGFEPNGDWGPLSREAYVACWVNGRENACAVLKHQHAEASAAGCDHPECIVNHAPRSST